MRVFISQSAKSDDERAARQAVVDAVRAAGHEPLVAELKGAIDPGERFRGHILRWMATCEAAIVLFTDSARRSKWVKYEASVLSFRAETEGIRVIPIWYGGAHTQQGAREEAVRFLADAEYAPLDLGAIQIGTVTGGEADYAELLGALGTATTAPAAPLDKWVRHVVALLRDVPRMELEEAAEELVIHGDERRASVTTDDDLRYMIGAALLTETFAPRHITPGGGRAAVAASRTRVYEALDRLAPALYCGKLEELKTRVLPAWVDSAPAAQLHEVARRPMFADRLAAVGLTRAALAEHYAHRALNTWRAEVYSVPVSYGEDEGEAVEQILEALVKFRNIEEWTAEDEEDDLARAGRPVFLVLNAQETGYDRTFLTLLRQRTGRATLVLLSGREHRAVQGLAGVSPLQPTLAEDEEHEVWGWVKRVRQLRS